MNIKDVLRYGWQGARERADTKPNPYADRPGLESQRGPIGAISRLGGNIGRGVLGWFDDEDKPPLLSMPGPVSIDNPRSTSINSTRGMSGPVDIPNPSEFSVGRNDNPEMTEAERQQQREQFDRYRNDPNSIYYQGPRAGDPMPGEIVGPNAHVFRNPTRELYEANQVRTGSGQGFNDAVAYYRSTQKPNRNITQ